MRITTTYNPRHALELPRIFTRGYDDLIDTAPRTPGYVARHARGEQS